MINDFRTMVVIKKPTEISSVHLQQIVDLIKTGGEVKTSREDLRKYIQRADLVAYELLDDTVICTATLKNPFNTYKTKVFNKARVKSNLKINKELGYIATHPDHENKGHCSQLLNSFLKDISQNSIYSTTRKAAMAHILGKFNFQWEGKTFDKDLKLLIYHGKK